jgi:hypothetical protein
VLQEILSRLSRRDHPRTEAEVQADVRQFILEAPFELDEGDLDIVSLESPVTGGRRIDVEVGSVVIEVKRDFCRGRVLEEAVQQLGGYVRTRTSETGRRYVGVLTDGVEWRCYALAGEDLKQVSSQGPSHRGGDRDHHGPRPSRRTIDSGFALSQSRSGARPIRDPKARKGNKSSRLNSRPLNFGRVQKGEKRLDIKWLGDLDSNQD